MLFGGDVGVATSCVPPWRVGWIVVVEVVARLACTRALRGRHGLRRGVFDPVSGMDPRCMRDGTWARVRALE